MDTAFSPDASRLLTFGLNKTAMIWNIPQRKIERMLGVNHDQRIDVGQFSPDGRFMVTGSRDNSAWIVDGTESQGMFRLWHKFWVLSADFSRNGEMLVTTSNKLYLWHTRSGEELAVWEPPGRYHSEARFSPER